MAEGFRASDEDWEELRRHADGFLGTHRCILELADRIAALEHGQQQAAEPTQQASAPKFCVGQRWRQKCGDVVRIEEIENNSDRPITTFLESQPSRFFAYTLEGKWLLDDKPLGHSPRDLIELVDEAAPASAEQQASAQPESMGDGRVATDKELQSLFVDECMTWGQALRAAYNLGRQHGSRSPDPAPPAPTGGLVERSWKSPGSPRLTRNWR
jgi:hypothetical protein